MFDGRSSLFLFRLGFLVCTRVGEVTFSGRIASPCGTFLEVPFEYVTAGKGIATETASVGSGTRICRGLVRDEQWALMGTYA